MDSQSSFYITWLVSISWFAGPFLFFYILLLVIRNLITYFYEKVWKEFRWQMKTIFAVEGILCTLLGASLSLFIIYAIGLKVIHWGAAPLIFLLIWPFMIHSFREIEPQADRGIFEKVYQRCPWTEHNIFSYPRAVLYGIKNQFLVFCIVTLVLALGTVLIVAFTYDLCVCQFPFDVSSRATRLMSTASCQESVVCNTYLNLPQDPQTQMIVRFLTASPTNASYVYYDTVSRPNFTDYSQQQSCRFESLNDMFNEENRYLHTCELQGLSPNTIYYFRSLYLQLSLGTVTVIYSNETAFKTMNLVNNTYASSGGLQIGEISTALIANAMKFNPEFFILGGDFINESGSPGCYRRWDEFFRQYSQHFITASGLMVPILTIPGVNEARNNEFGQSRSEILPYTRYIIHNFGNYTNLTHWHNIGNHTIILGLDSDVATPFDDQIPFIKDSFDRNIEKNKLVFYHLPMYPSSRDPKDGLSLSARKSWEPWFNYYNVSVAYEFHDHLLKRSKPLRNGQIMSNGTVYIGDGGLGVNGDVYNLGVDRSYLEYLPSVNPHVWVSHASASQVSGQAIAPDGTILDHFLIVYNKII